MTKNVERDIESKKLLPINNFLTTDIPVNALSNLYAFDCLFIPFSIGKKPN